MYLGLLFLFVRAGVASRLAFTFFAVCCYGTNYVYKENKKGAEESCDFRACCCYVTVDVYDIK